jgi:hypothetical protein
MEITINEMSFCIKIFGKRTPQAMKIMGALSK